MEFADKISLITGGTKGIGLAVAKKLHAKGATVCLVYGSDEASATRAAQELANNRVSLIKADLTNVDNSKTIVQQVVSKYGRIDILINNAAVMESLTLETTTPEAFDKSFNLNVKSPWFLTQAAVPHMPAGSHVLFVSTSLTHHSLVLPNYSLYVATKGAIEQMVRTFAKDLASKNIIVNVVSPGPTATDLFLEGKSEQLLEKLKSMNPFNKFGTPEEVADAYLFLVSPNNTWVSGQNLRTNGALVL